MNKLTLRDIWPPPVYGPIRAEMQRKAIELKKPRRVALGPHVTLVFENRATMIFQVCEMLRAESVVDPVRIQHELEVYNALLPDDGQLSATLFVEITDEQDIRPVLHRMVGLDAHVALEVAGERVPAVFEAGRSEEDRIASVQYLRFGLGEAARRAIATPGAKVVLLSDLPGYEHRVELGEATRQSLAADLA